MQAQLPPGWIALQAPDGRWYYAYQPTGQTQWNPPYPTQNTQPPPPSHPQPGMPSGYPQGTTAQPYAAQSMPAQSSGQYTFQHPVELKVKEKAFSISGDGFSVKRVDNGQAMFKVKGNLLSITDSKSIVDMNGAPIYKMKEALLSLRGRMHIVDPRSGSVVYCLRKKGFVKFFGTGTVQIWRGPSDEGAPYLQIKGNVFKKDFSIVEVASGRSVAFVKRKPFTLTNFLLEKDTYVVKVEPGQDCALMVMLVVALDEQYRDDGNESGIF